MLKKIVFVAALAMVASAYGATNPNPESGITWNTDGNWVEVKGEAWSWPATFNYEPICVIPVKMDIGYWIRVTNCNDRELKLKQTGVHNYKGNVTINIACNVNIQVTADWAKASGMPTMNKDFLTCTPSNLDAPGGDVVVELALKDVDLAGIAGGQNCVQVGTVTVKVRPNVKPQLAGGCG
jgi:hypothetical protein